MSDKKQTSVDVLFEILWETPKDKWEWNAVLKKVKELHKEEMRELYLAHVTKVPRLKKIFEKQFEEYYNETFGGTTGGIGVDKISWTNTSGTNHLSHINPLTDKLSLSNILDLYIKETARGMDMWSKEENETMTTIGNIIESLSRQD